MRTVTFSDERVLEFLDDHFALTWTNQLPEFFKPKDPSTPPRTYPAEMIAQFPEGGGGGNVRVFICTSDGLVVHQLRGQWNRDRFIEEARFGLELVGKSRDAIVRAHAEHAADHARERDALPPIDPAERNSPTARRAAALNLLRRCHEEAPVLEPIGAVLDRIETEVYTKGAIG